jgi:glycosyltransferase involved in cell wall biosynthesis
LLFDVEVLGGVEDLPRLMREFTLGLVSSIGSEANCRVGLEMMACGIPVVATRIGVIPEVVRDRKDGLIVPPNDPGAMAEAVTRLLKDGGLRNRMARSASERAAGMFSLDGMVERTEEWYRELIGRKGPRD